MVCVPGGSRRFIMSSEPSVPPQKGTVFLRQLHPSEAVARRMQKIMLDTVDSLAVTCYVTHNSVRPVGTATMTIRNYRDKRTASFVEGERVRAFEGFEGQAAKAVTKLQSATRLMDLRYPPSNRFQALGG